MTVFTLIFGVALILLMLFTKFLLGLSLVLVLWSIYAVYRASVWEGKKYRPATILNPEEFSVLGGSEPWQREMQEVFQRIQTAADQLKVEDLEGLAQGKAFTTLLRAIEARRASDWKPPLYVELKQVYLTALDTYPLRIQVRLTGRRRFPSDRPTLLGPPWESFGEDWWLEKQDAGWVLTDKERLNLK